MVLRSRGGKNGTGEQWRNEGISTLINLFCSNKIHALNTRLIPRVKTLAPRGCCQVCPFGFRERFYTGSRWSWVLGRVKDNSTQHELIVQWAEMQHRDKGVNRSAQNRTK